MYSRSSERNVVCINVEEWEEGNTVADSCVDNHEPITGRASALDKCQISFMGDNDNMPFASISLVMTAAHSSKNSGEGSFDGQ